MIDKDLFKEVDISEGFDVEKVGSCLKYKNKPVYFLITRRGDAIEIHVGAKGRDGKLLIREAASAVIDWIPQKYEWCKMIIATVSVKSVYNLCIKIGFSDLGESNLFRPVCNLMVIKL